MTTAPDNPQAFPFQESSYGTAQPEYGMTLRDWFAGQALAGGLARAEMHRPATTQDMTKALAGVAYDIADAMLAARESAA